VCEHFGYLTSAGSSLHPNPPDEWKILRQRDVLDGVSDFMLDEEELP
jgi:hypothetical protein